MPSSHRVRVVLATAALILGACASDGDDTESGADVSVEVVLERTAVAMSSVDSAEFSIEQTGAEVHIDEAGLIRFGGATGRYLAPSSADALLTVAAVGLTTEVGAVAVEGRMWITNPLTGTWEEAPEGFSFDPSVLFDPETGWSALLSDGLSEPTLLEGGDDRHHVRGIVDGARVSALTGGLVEDSSEVDLWIDAATDRVDEVTFDVETDAGPTSWRLLLTGYDSAITITEPTVGADGD